MEIITLGLTFFFSTKIPYTTQAQETIGLRKCSLASFPKRRGPRVHLVTLGLWTYSFWFSVATDGLVVQWAVSCWATFWWSWEWDDNWASYCQLFEVIILVHQNNEDRSTIGNWLTALPPLSVCLFVSETGLAAQLGRPRTHDHSAFWIVELS